MFRARPYWYNTALPEILVEFSNILSDGRPTNLRLLDSFPTPEFQADGVHLTAYSGLRFEDLSCLGDFRMGVHKMIFTLLRLHLAFPTSVNPLAYFRWQHVVK